MNSETKRRLQSLASALLAAPMVWLGYAIALCIPRRSDLWVFGSWDGFRYADNAKWLFEEAVRQSYGNQILWITRSRAVSSKLAAEGLPVALAYSLRGIVALLRAGTYVFDSDSRGVSFWSSAGARRVNLFHGIPLKRVGKAVTLPGNFYNDGHRGPLLKRVVLRLLAPWFFERYDVLIASSPEMALILGEALGAGDTKTGVTGLPRNDALFLAQPSAMRSHRPELENWPMHARGRRIVVYMPTFRDEARMGRQIPLDWSSLAKMCQEKGSIFVLKLHPLDVASLPKELPEEIFVATAGSDPYPLLSITDVLVTDYSSVYLDFLLVDRPIVFFPYDLEAYLARSRDMYFEYEAVTPGPRALTSEALTEAIAEALDSPGKWATSRRQMLDRFHTHQDGHSARRTWAFLRATM